METETQPGFEASLRQLEKTVKALEGGELGLDDALSQYEAGIRLLARCHGMLEEADRKVALLTGVEEDGTPATAPFDASATYEAPAARPRPVADATLDDLPF